MVAALRESGFLLTEELDQLRAEALDLDRQRSDYLNREMRRSGATGFDAEVMQMLRDQAKKHKIAY